MTAFRAFEREGGATAREVSDVSLVNLRNVQRRIKELTGTRLVKAPLIKHGYQLSLAESSKMRRFVEEGIAMKRTTKYPRWRKRRP